MTGVSLRAAGLELPPILRGVDFAADPGEVTTVIGPNGAGKSTLLACLAGVARPARGELHVAGSPLLGRGARERARLISFVPQDTGAGAEMTAADLVGMGRHPRLGRFDRPGPGDRAAVRDALRRTDTTHLADRLVGALSGGERQRVHIARALAQDTPVLLLDEPVSALDLRHRVAVAGLLRGLAAEGRTVVTVVHDLTLAARLSDRVAVLVDGTLRAQGTTAETLTEEIISAAYGVRARLHTDPFTRTPVITAT